MIGAAAYFFVKLFYLLLIVIPVVSTVSHCSHSLYNLNTSFSFTICKMWARASFFFAKARASSKKTQA